MLKLHVYGSPNDDTMLVAEDAVEAIQSVSSGPMPYSVIYLESGVMLQVKETVEVIGDAIQTWKASSKT